MSATAIFTKADAHPWFVEAVAPLSLGSQSTQQCWERAWAALELHRALPDRWKGWVLGEVDRALSKAKKDPAGLFYKLLGDPPADLAKPAPKPVSTRYEASEREWEATKAQRAHDEAEYGRRYGNAKPLPVGACVHLTQSGGDVRGLLREWEARGCPDPDEFDYPGWQDALTKWRNGTPFRGARRHA